MSTPRCASCSTPPLLQSVCDALVGGADRRAPKPELELPLKGISATIYMDKGPASRSKVFQSVMGSHGVRVLTHIPPSEAERRTLARLNDS